MPHTSLNTDADLDQARAESRDRPVVLFKHSVTCPVSAYVRREIHQLDEREDPSVYELTVQAARSLSDKIATDYSIRHESPQVILLYRERPIFHASHRRVTAEAVREAARQAMRDAVA